MKQCTECKQDKELFEFGKDCCSPDGYTYQCKKCKNNRSRNYRNKTKTGKGLHWIADHYNLTPVQYNQLIQQAQGKCQLCKETPKRLVLDHCNQTGIIRGLLCDRCNLSLGLFNHNSQIINSAIIYLETSSKEINLNWYIEELSKQDVKTMKGSGRLYPKEGHLRKFRDFYHIDQHQFERLRSKQNYLCKICNQQKKLCIDHCHRTQQIRGLLCESCNQGIGLFKEDIQILQFAINYLNQFVGLKPNIAVLLSQL